MHAEQKTRRHLFCRKAENFLGKQKNRKIMLNWTGKRHFHVKTWILKQSRPSYYWKPLPEPENQTSKSLFRLFWKKKQKNKFWFYITDPMYRQNVTYQHFWDYSSAHFFAPIVDLLWQKGLCKFSWRETKLHHSLNVSLWLAVSAISSAS